MLNRRATYRVADAGLIRWLGWQKLAFIKENYSLVAAISRFASHLFGSPTNLEFTIPEVVAVLVSVFIVKQVVSDGESNRIEGVQLLSVYAILGILFYFLPEAH